VPDDLVGDARITAMGVQRPWRAHVLFDCNEHASPGYKHMFGILLLTPLGVSNQMATSSSSAGARKPATTRKNTTSRKSTASTTTSTQPKTAVEQAQVLAERVVLVPVGASLLARDNVVSTVKGFATKYRTRAGLERELKRYERRGVTARNRFERQVRKTRTRFERELRQRRTRVERTVKQNRRRLEREVRNVRKDLDKQSRVLSQRVEKLLSTAS
ncbi:MAG TPA: hypothetical protein VGX45_11990, partial [Solirubrobacteraceae bacterium]|nr:hypothetical protein [Solirubrobacteraceae bacterium]